MPDYDPLTISDEELKALPEFSRRTIRNHRGERVGEARADFRLAFRGL